MPADVEIHPAATVALVRDGARGIQTLLLRRSAELAFAADCWVFPGGRVEDADLAAAGGDPDAGARIAAARESREECALAPRLEDMLLLSHWTTPSGKSRRFSTWIFVAPLSRAGEVVVDGGEIHEHRWLTAAEALALHRNGALSLLPPTMITLRQISRYADVAALAAGVRCGPVPRISPVLRQTAAGDRVSMYPGDAGYAAGDPELPGPRHRSIYAGDHWVYTYEQVDAAHPPLVPLD